MNEDPWERPKRLKKLLPNTKLQMLLRGQNLVGYRNYADDVVEAFVTHAAEVGIDIFRIFDALNDERNMETSIKAVKKTGKHAQLTLSYSLTERKLGGPVFNIEYFLNKAKLMQQMGADSLCIKDMAGLIAPDDAYTLVSELKKVISVPIHLHTHYTSGMASMSCLKAIEADVDGIDTCLAPFALRSSHPAVEPMVVALYGTERETGLDLNHLFKLGEYIESVAPKYRDYMNNTKMAVVDTAVLMHQIPGGMTTNLVSQLREADAIDKLDEVLAELPRVRKELGYPPLVTPTSQIVGIQAVQNVLFGRYKMISTQVRDYCYGLYGRPPAAVDPKVRKLALKNYPRGETPITHRAADSLEPEMAEAKEAIKDITTDIGDVLTFALYPVTGLRFLKWKYGLETPPPEVAPKTMEEIRREDELIEKIRAGKLGELQNLERFEGMRKYRVHFGGNTFEIGLEDMGNAEVSDSAPTPKAVAQPAPAPAAPQKEVKGTKIIAPMPGIIISYEAKVGDALSEDQPLVILEAMKMANTIVANKAGTLKMINFKPGDKVSKDDVLAIID